METITLHIGRSVIVGGCQQDNLRPVQFEGELIGSRREFIDERGTRGVDQSLYRTADGRLIVYVENWSRWQGEPTTSKLVQVQPADLDAGGPYELLGRACGMARALSLDEALEVA